MDDERYESDVSSTDSLDYFTFRDGLAVAVERCPLCMRSRRPFYCKDCVNTGNFSRNSGESERYTPIVDSFEALKISSTVLFYMWLYVLKFVCETFTGTFLFFIPDIPIYNRN